MTDMLDVLRTVSLETVAPPKAIWADDTVVVEDLHRDELVRVSRLREQLRSDGLRKNIRLVGRAGSGKSHFLSRVRRDAIASGDLFVVVHLSQVDGFWQSVALAYAEALFKRHEGVTQLQGLLDKFLRRCGVSDAQAIAIVAGDVSERILTDLKHAIVRRLGRGPRARTAADVALALVLLNSENSEHWDIAYSFFEGVELDEENRRKYALNHAQIPPQHVVTAMDLIVKTCGQVSVTALDQLDGLITIARKAMAVGDFSELNIIANNLMELAEITDNTVVIVSCQRATWEVIKNEAIQSAHYRYSEEIRIGELPSSETGRELVARALKRVYDRIAFKPDYPTWPVRPSAFDDAPDFTPRALLLAVEEHIARCVRAGEVKEMVTLEAQPHPYAGDGGEGPVNPTLDARFDSLKAAADPSQILAGGVMDTELTPLLHSALAAWIGENTGEASFALAEAGGPKSALHARLRQILDADREDEIHWSFRAIPHSHGTAQLARLRAAVTESGLGGRQRHLIIVRNEAFSSGAKTQAELAEFRRRGGVVAELTADDVATFQALHLLVGEKPSGFAAWLKARRPASGTRLLGLIGSEKVETGGGQADPAKARDGGAVPPRGKAETPEVPEHHILLGVAQQDERVLTVPLVDLRRHVVVFAGSGSGKTVFLRRLVEECALKGVSSIVLDPNNDLARLGTLPPEPPEGWLPGDADKSRRYGEEVEAVIFTPGMSSGRPLAFAPIAGLAAVSGDADEFDIALDRAVDLLVPRAKLSVRSGKGSQGRAVLKQALRAYAARGGERLSDFLAHLAALPEGVSDLENAEKLATDMAENLKAEAVNDKLFGDDAEAADPAVLLTPSPGKRARVSIVSFAGLASQEQQQRFVSELQLALFSYVKRNPASERALTGLLVMDEAQNFAPSGASTPSLQSTLALASQARKYGLGLLFATQAPKGLDNKIPGNASTHLLGLLTASVQIDAARELAAGRGGRLDAISKLKPGEFYLARVGHPFERVRTPFCLTHHPKSPLAPDEVMALARRAA